MLVSRASITRLARFPPLAAASMRPFQEGLGQSRQSPGWTCFLIRTGGWILTHNISWH